jgi:hypothetical protein
MCHHMIFSSGTGPDVLYLDNCVRHFYGFTAWISGRVIPRWLISSIQTYSISELTRWISGLEVILKCQL